MNNKRKVQALINRIEFINKTGRHKKQLIVLKKELANLS